MGLDVVRKATGVSVYLSMPTKEVTTDPILEQLLSGSQARSIYVPKVIITP